MKYLLDTNVCIDALKGREDVIRRFREKSPEEVAISAITSFELIQGAERAPVEFREREKGKVERFLSAMTVIPFDFASSIIAGRLNAILLRQGTPVGVADVFIASIALALKSPVVTSNTRDFLKIEGLEVINWRD